VPWAARPTLGPLRAPFARYHVQAPADSARGGADSLPALDADTGITVSVQVLAGWAQLDEAERGARLAALEALAPIRHLHLPRLLAVGDRPDGNPFAVFEACPGEPLSARRSVAPLPRAQAIGAVCQVLEALEALHAHGLVHRFVAPEHAIAVTGRAGPVVRLAGLVHAVRADAGAATRWRLGAGAARSMPPEQLLGKPLDARADIYAAGALLWELLHGRPFEPALVDGPLVRGDPVPALEAALRQALAARAPDRFGSARAMRRALTPLCGADAVADPG
jgi:serine/threonine-protein kinase